MVNKENLFLRKKKTCKANAMCLLTIGVVKLTNDDVATNTYSMLVFCRRATNSAVRFSSYEKAHERQQRPFILLEWPF